VFLGGPIDIQGVNGGAATGAGIAEFNETSTSATMTLAQHNGFAMPFQGTGGTQTITLTTSGTATGDGGIEHYVLANGDDTFVVAPDGGAFKQTVDISAGGVDVIQYGSPFSGSLTGAAADDTVQFLAGGGDVDISEVNGGEATGAGTASFSDAAITVSMTLAQHNGLTPPFIDTADTQTIVLTTGGTVTGDAGIENYVVVGDADYTFVVAKDDAGLVGGSQNLDLVDPDVFNDTVVFGAGTFSGMLKNAGKGDTVQFSGGAASVAGINLGLAFGPDVAARLSNAAVDVTMTLAQHNGLAMPFLETAGTQTITLATDGITTGDAGIEQYVLGEDGANSNEFTIGILDQSVTGRKDDDVIINPFGGPTGILRGGANNFQGDTLILQAANTAIALGSGGFENLTLEAAGSTTTRMNAALHDDLTGNIVAPGADDKIILIDAIDGTGLANIESYQFLGNGTNFFTFSDWQTGTVTGLGGASSDNFFATADQIAKVTELDGGGNLDQLTITTDAEGIDLQAKTKGIEIYQLHAGSTGNVTGANGDEISYTTVTGNASAIVTMGVGKQHYTGGTGSDDVTFGTGDGTMIDTDGGNDDVRSTVGGVWSAATSVAGGAAALADTLHLVGGDDLSAATVMDFENLVLALNAAVTMKNAQHALFDGASTIAPGNETIVITDTFTGTTMKNVENYNLQGAANDFTVAYDDVTITSAGVGGAMVVKTGLDNVKLAAADGAAYVVFLDSNTKLDITLNATEHDTVDVAGAITGSVIAGNSGGVTDTLQLHNGADISKATVGIGADSMFEALDLEENGSFTMTADQYIGLTQGPVTATGFETVTITTSSGATIHNRLNIEAYILAGGGNDTFKHDLFPSVNNHTLDINAGGFDTIILRNDGFFNSDAHLTVAGFETNGDVDTIVSLAFGTINIGNGGFQTIVAMDTDRTVGTNSTIAINTTVTTLTNPANVDQVKDAIALAIKDNPTGGLFTFALYDAAGHADIYQVAMIASADLTPGDINFVLYAAQLTGVAPNTLIGTNFG